MSPTIKMVDQWSFFISAIFSPSPRQIRAGRWQQLQRDLVELASTLSSDLQSGLEPQVARDKPLYRADGYIRIF